MEKYILSIDQGTTSTRAILFDKNGENKCYSFRDVTCIYPHSGWVETDANAIFLSATECVSEILIKANITSENIDSIAITNQRETTVVWEKSTGLPVCNAIVWQSRQTVSICEKYEQYKDIIREKTGLYINPYFSATKIRFILDSIPNGQERAEKGELCFGTIDTWLIYKLTGGKVHATDVSNASRTLLYNINTMSWDEELCKLFNIPLNMLPSVYPSSYEFGKTMLSNIPICGVAGDQQAALFGQTCFEVGDCKNTYGTGCFMLMNIGDKPKFSNNGLLTTVAWQIGDKVTYALEGSVFIGGAVIQWLRDEMKLISDASESQTLAEHCDDSHRIYLVPAFVGLGTPYWDDEARGAVFGMTRNTSKAHFVKAALESIAYQCKDVFFVMEQDTGIKIKSLQVDGGATANDYLMQFQSDLLGVSIKLPKCLQTTALGAAYLAGLCTGFYTSAQDIKNIHSYKKEFNQLMPEEEVNSRYEGWKKAVKATIEFK